jgi:peptidoglycan/LPS O-acetylase OafA/YrhL
MRPTYIPSLDGLRAFSILVVFLSHAGMRGVVPGYFGVLVFFLLSGFLITTLLRTEFEAYGSISLGAFYRRRVYRIWPPFYFFLALATAVQVLTEVNNRQISPSLFGLQAAHLANYAVIWHGWDSGRAVGTFLYWSLAVEEHFYLVFPVFYLWMLKASFSRDKQSRILMTVCIAVLLWRCILVFGMDANKERIYVATDTRFDSILFGCWLAVAANPWLDPPRMSVRLLNFVAVPIGLGVVVLSFLPRQFWFDQTLRYTLQVIGLMPLFVAAIRSPDMWPWRILNFRAVRFAGVLSYSAYLSHATIIAWVKAWVGGPALMQGILSFVLVLLIYYAVHVLIEQPFARRRKRNSPDRSHGSRSGEPLTDGFPKVSP